MFKNLPSLTSIKTFEASARLKSFKQAAHELNVSPTAVSHQIRSLESALDLKLFLRHPRSVSLTREGELLAETSTRLLRDLSYTINMITETPHTLRISTTNSFAAMWLVPNLEGFRKRHPGVEVQISADDQLQNIAADRGIDMVIRYGKFKSQPGAELLISESLGCYAKPEYWQGLIGQECWTFLCAKWKNADLAQQDYEKFLTAVVPRGTQWKTRYFNDENQILQAALAGQGVAILSELLVKTPLLQGWLQQGFNDLAHELVGLDYYCIIPPRSSHNKSALNFLAWLKTNIAG